MALFRDCILCISDYIQRSQKVFGQLEVTHTSMFTICDVLYVQYVFICE